MNATVTSPGGGRRIAVVLFNLGNVPMLFRVYATDAFNNVDGQFDLIPGDEDRVRDAIDRLVAVLAGRKS